jgi:L-ribulokinase
MVAAVLCGIKDFDQVPRSVCAMGHKWMWNQALGGLRPRSSWWPWLLAASRKLGPLCHLTSRRRLSPEWAARLDFRRRPIRWVRSMRTGTPSVPAFAKAMS